MNLQAASPGLACAAGGADGIGQVQDQAEHCQVKLVRHAVNRRQAGGDFSGHFHILVDHFVAGNFQRLAQQGGNTHRLGPVGWRAVKLAHAVDQFDHAGGFLQAQAQVVGHLRRIVHVLQRQGERAPDGLHGVVDLVGQAGGQASDGAQALVLHGALVQPLAFFHQTHGAGVQPGIVQADRDDLDGGSQQRIFGRSDAIRTLVELIYPVEQNCYAEGLPGLCHRNEKQIAGSNAKLLAQRCNQKLLFGRVRQRLDGLFGQAGERD